MRISDWSSDVCSSDLPASALALARADAADVFAIKIEQSGGLQAAQQVAAIGDAAQIELYGGTMLEGPIGTIASAHVFSTFRSLQWGTELFGPLLLTEQILQQPLEYKDFQQIGRASCRERVCQ